MRNEISIKNVFSFRALSCRRKQGLRLKFSSANENFKRGGMIFSCSRARMIFSISRPSGGAYSTCMAQIFGHDYKKLRDGKTTINISFLISRRGLGHWGQRGNIVQKRWISREMPKHKKIESGYLIVRNFVELARCPFCGLPSSSSPCLTRRLARPVKSCVFVLPARILKPRNYWSDRKVTSEGPSPSDSKVTSRWLKSNASTGWVTFKSLCESLEERPSEVTFESLFGHCNCFSVLGVLAGKQKHKSREPSGRGGWRGHYRDLGGGLRGWSRRWRRTFRRPRLSMPQPVTLTPPY